MLQNQKGTYPFLWVGIQGNCFFAYIGVPHVGFTHNTIFSAFMSQDQNCVFAYPLVDLTPEPYALRDGTLISDEIRTVNRDIHIDPKQFVTIIAKEDMSQYSNADTVAIYELNFEKIGFKYMERYNHCIGIYLRKRGHPLLAFKVFLNDEGYKDKNTYIQDLLENVRYGNNITPLLEVEKELAGSDFDFREFHLCSAYSQDEYVQRNQARWDKLKVEWKAENDSIKRIWTY